MLFWITLILFVISFAMAIFYYGYFETFGGFMATVGLGLTLFIMLLVMLFNYIPAETQLEAIQERHDALVFKLEHEEIRDEFGLINNDILTSIRLWNEDVRKGKKLQDNFWIGIFIPDLYDEFDCIDYDEIFNEGELKND